jgi:Flp pilus assembly protein TadG
VTRRPGRPRPSPARAAGPTGASARADDGMVTAEFAVALPAFVVVVMAAICGVAVVMAQLRCVDAAAVAARMAARGEPATQVRTTSLSGAPAGARLDLTDSTDFVTATVQATVSAPGVLGFLPGITLHAHIVQAREPAASGPVP